MTEERLLQGMSLINPDYIAEAAPDRKQLSRRLVALLAAAALTLLLVSCGAAVLSQDAIREQILQYKLEGYLLRMSREDIRFIGMEGDYAMVYYSGTGPTLMLYRYETEGEHVQVLERIPGDEAISGGISINHWEKDGQHIYFGTINNRHWIPPDDSVLNYTPKYLRVTDENGNVRELDVEGLGGYLCILDAPLADFQLIDAEGQAALDYALYAANGYPIAEAIGYPEK